MTLFILRRLGTMLLTALVLTFFVFALTNLRPSLEKLAKSEGSVRMSDADVESWLDENGFGRPIVLRYGEWLGVVPGWTREEDGVVRGRCIRQGDDPAEAPRFCGVLQGDWGISTVFKRPVLEVVGNGLAATGVLMAWVMAIMVPGALVVGIFAGMREGSRLDRVLSTGSIVTTATPEYVSGVIFIALFATPAFGMNWFKGTATSAMTEGVSFANFTLPVLTIALYGMGYIARMTRAAMTEVMTAQYIRTARLKGVSFPNVVLRHALRNALIAPFTVIMLQFPWLLNGVVIVETLFN